jgi:hypothetical protein
MLLTAVTEASLTGQQDQSELFRLRIFTIGIQELAYLATSRGKQVYRRHRNLSPHSWLRIPLSLSERKGIRLDRYPLGRPTLQRKQIITGLCTGVAGWLVGSRLLEGSRLVGG